MGQRGRVPDETIFWEEVSKHRNGRGRCPDYRTLLEIQAPHSSSEGLTRGSPAPSGRRRAPAPHFLSHPQPGPAGGSRCTAASTPASGCRAAGSTARAPRPPPQCATPRGRGNRTTSQPEGSRGAGLPGGCGVPRRRARAGPPPRVPAAPGNVGHRAERPHVSPPAATASAPIM